MRDLIFRDLSFRDLSWQPGLLELEFYMLRFPMLVVFSGHNDRSALCRMASCKWCPP